MGSGPPLNFKSLLHYLIDNYTGCVPTLIVATAAPTTLPTVSLPTTLQLLKSTCEVCASHEVSDIVVDHTALYAYLSSFQGQPVSAASSYRG